MSDILQTSDLPDISEEQLARHNTSKDMVECGNSVASGSCPGRETDATAVSPNEVSTDQPTMGSGRTRISTMTIWPNGIAAEEERRLVPEPDSSTLPTKTGKGLAGGLFPRARDIKEVTDARTDRRRAQLDEGARPGCGEYQKDGLGSGS
jgi:hypothetical protein